MSYFRKSGIFARTNTSTTTFTAGNLTTIPLDKSILNGTDFDGTNLTSDSNTILVQCDIRFYFSATFASYAESYFSGGAVEDRARQISPAAAGQLHSRDEFWGLGSSIRPLSGAGADGALTLYSNYVLAIGLIL